MLERSFEHGNEFIECHLTASAEASEFLGGLYCDTQLVQAAGRKRLHTHRLNWRAVCRAADDNEEGAERYPPIKSTERLIAHGHVCKVTQRLEHAWVQAAPVRARVLEETLARDGVGAALARRQRA